MVRYFSNFIKILLTVIVITLGIKFGLSNLEDIRIYLLKLDLIEVIFPTTIIFIAYQFPFLRLKYIQKYVSVNVFKKNFYHVYLGSFFVNQVTPSGIGGDIYKLYKFKKFFSFKESVLLVVLDRFSGLFHLTFFAGTIFLYLFAGFSISIVFLTILLISLFLLLHGDRLRRFMLVNFSSIFSPYINVVLNLRISFLNFAHYFFIVISLIALFRLFDITIPFIGQLTFALCFVLSSIIPASIGPWGIREVFSIYAAKFFILDPTIAFSISLIFGCMVFIASFLGVLSLLYVEISDAKYSTSP